MNLKGLHTHTKVPFVVAKQRRVKKSCVNITFNHSVFQQEGLLKPPVTHNHEAITLAAIYEHERFRFTVGRRNIN